MAFIVASFTNIEFVICSVSILQRFDSSVEQSRSALTLSSEARRPLLRATLARVNSILSSSFGEMTWVAIIFLG